MLNLYPLARPDDKQSLIEPLVSGDFLYIASDVESKFFWQNYFLEKSDGLIGGDLVLRASELWSQILKSLDPSWKIVDPGTLLFFVEKWMSEFTANTGVVVSLRDRQGAYDFLKQLLPVVSHENGYEAIREWFEERPEAYDSWSQWYLLSQYLWQHLRQKRIVADEFVSGLLVLEDLEGVSLPHLIVDLGLQLQATEAELLLLLSRTHSVSVIVPENALKDELSSYHQLMDEVGAQVHGNSESRCATPDFRIDPMLVTRPEYKKLPSMLSEVKHAVAQVREWLDAGGAIEKIAIVSPIIENYWPTLFEYLSKEGIPVQKPVVAPYSQSMDLHQWMSALKISLNQGKTVDLRQFFFMNPEDNGLSFQDYQRQFTNFYGTQDLERDPNFSKSTPKLWTDASPCLFHEFLSFALEYWPHPDFSGVESWLPELDTVWSCSESLLPEKWLEYLERFFTRKEKRLQAGASQGLLVKSLGGIENVHVESLIVLGMSQQSLRSSTKTPVTLADALSLKSLYGFFIDHGDREQKRQQLQWIQTKEFKNIQYLYGEADFTGAFLSPSPIWISGALESKSMDVVPPSESRWDSLMKGALEQLVPDAGKNDEAWSSKFREGLAREQASGDQWSVKIPNLSLSASMMEEYFKCPFRVMVQKGFGLRTVPSLDLDVDYQTRGVLLHKICEIVLSAQTLSLESSFIEGVIRQARKAEGAFLVEEDFWPYFEKFYYKITEAFVTFELRWRTDFPETATYATEKPIRGFISPDAPNLFSMEPGGGALAFRGKVDRIDRAESGDLIVIDYKTSSSGLFQYGSWLKKGLFQNIIYVLAVREGLATGVAEKVSGAFYFVLKDMDRKLGAHSVESETFLPPHKGRLPFEDLVERGTELLREQLSQLFDHRFPTDPQETKICETCSWGSICRRSRGVQ